MSAGFDVFLSYNSQDYPAVRQIADLLIEKGLHPWLDVDQIRPGTSWHTELGQQIETIKAAAIFIGASGLGPWQDQEVQALLNQFVRRNCPVIPVILSSAIGDPELPWMFPNLHRVDFRRRPPDPLQQLLWGITGIKPDGQPQPTATPATRAASADLFPRKDVIPIEISLPGKLDHYTPQAKEDFLQKLSAIAQIGGEIRLKPATGGSVQLQLPPEDADRIYNAAQSGELTDLGVSSVRLYPSLASIPSPHEQAQLAILRHLVDEYWIQGLLRHSLHREVFISLPKRPLPEAVTPQWKQHLRLPEQRHYLSLPDQKIATIFEATGLLLILGAPGSGKTTTLLDLAENLLRRAAASPAKERIPVILNLSSWTTTQSLHDWIVSELSSKYRVPTKTGRSWLERGYLVPLLDGLDEVHSECRAACAVAINSFINEYHPAGLVVCCRLEEYQWLPHRLYLSGAVSLEPLSREEITSYLAFAGPDLTSLREAVRTDPLLEELVQTPLMLSIASLAYQGDHRDELTDRPAISLEQAREKIFTLYLDAVFTRKAHTPSRFTRSEITHSLTWLAYQMRKHAQSVFLVEDLQPTWLEKRAETIAYKLSTLLTASLYIALTLGITCIIPSIVPHSISIDYLHSASKNILIGAKIVPIATLIIFTALATGYQTRSLGKNSMICLITGGLSFLLFLSLIFGSLSSSAIIPAFTSGIFISATVFFSIGNLTYIHCIETVRWKWKYFLINTLLSVAAFNLPFAISHVTSYFDLTAEAPSPLLPMAFIGLLLGCILGIISSWTSELSDSKSFPNEGIAMSNRNARKFFLVTSLTICAFSGAIIFVLPFRGGEPLSPEFGLKAFNMSAMLALIFGSLVALHRGGSTVIKHYALRLVLWWKGYTPRRFIPFLDECARLILLRKVGGGYLFIHRSLLDFFADRKTEPGHSPAGNPAVS